MISNEQLVAMGQAAGCAFVVEQYNHWRLGACFRRKSRGSRFSVGELPQARDRVLLAIRLLEVDALQFGVSTGVYQNLETALRHALAWVSIDFSVNDVEVDIETWLENEAEPWQAVSLTTETVELQKSADLVFSLGANLLKALAGYVAERKKLITEVNQAPS